MTVLALLLLCYVVPVSSASVPVHLYVSPTGDDTNDGRQSSHPVKTLHHVLNMLGADGIAGNMVFVEMMGGYYDLPSTLHLPSTITGDVIFRSYQGQEVHVTGGHRLASSQFHHVTDTHVLQRLVPAARARVLELDLTAAGIRDLGNLTAFGFVKHSHMPLEIFINGRPLRLAEWPDENFINVLSVPDGQHGRSFTYDADGRDVSRGWKGEREPWVYGWWYWSWADLSLAVSAVHSNNHTIRLRDNTRFGLRAGHYDPSHQNFQTRYLQQGGYFRVINMLCELDHPGEYYIDRGSNILYVWPDTPHQTLTSSDVVHVSILDDCIQIDRNSGRVQLQDFTLEACRYRGVLLKNACNVTLSHLEVKNTGGVAVQCSGDCRTLTVMACDIHDVSGGIFAGGGNTKTLTPSGNVLRDNHIWNHARYGAFPNDAIHIAGVGSMVTHNHLHHGQYTGIRWRGNDHVMEYNHVHHMCRNSSDCGAIHTGRDWTWRGNIIRYNHIHDTQRHFPGADVRGIMLDDEYSSVVIENNVFYNNDVHANIGGGRDNVIRNNVLYQALQYSMQVDGRGLGQNSHGPYLRNKLQNSSYHTDLWKARYPELYNILDKHPEAPEGNQIYNNVFYNALGKERVHYSGHKLRRKDYFDVHSNYRALHKTDFRSPDHGDFRLRCDAAQWAGDHDFLDPVTVDQVGPTVPTGPTYLQKQRQPQSPQPSSTPSDCDASTVAPSTSAPRGSFMPDGSQPNNLYPDIANTGCWLVIDHCPNHPGAQGTHQDAPGTQSGTEEGCLSRAAQQWRWCGSPSNGRVVAVFGPTGAMTFSAEGCYFAEWGCHSARPGLIHRDTWAEQHVNASQSEAACLNRALPQWRYCGSNSDRPYTSIFGPTGAFRTAGAGCWIKIPSCPGQPSLQGFFFDAWGDSNLGTGSSRPECLERAEHFWSQCGSHDNAPVTAFYRPESVSHTVSTTSK